ncbi:helix-turn-helix transcriptional regulator [Streptomyces sp. NPDC056661]|uniref:helix-turn-helix transcriptional regulator n=1 Tax=Streptomyces sp. NPDC056661 TaxID=3345898 RepID=UPI0036AB11A0
MSVSTNPDVGSNPLSAALLPFLEHSPAAVFLREREGRFVWTNAAYRQLICRSSEQELTGRMLEEILSEPYASLYRQLDDEVIERGTSLYDSVPFPRDGGTGRAVGFRFPVITLNGPGIGGAYIDTSELEETRRRWSAADECFRAVFDHTTAPTALLDVHGQITDTNPALCTLFGVAPSALRGRSPEEVVDFGTARGVDLWRQLTTGRRSRVQLAVISQRPNGSRFRARMTAAVVRRQDSTASLAVCSFDAIASLGESSTAMLTRTEIRLVVALAAGANNADLQRRMMLARQTVDYHLANLRAKLGADSRAAIVARAYATGVLEPGCWPPRAYADMQDTANGSAQS